MRLQSLAVTALDKRGAGHYKAAMKAPFLRAGTALFCVVTLAAAQFRPTPPRTPAAPPAPAPGASAAFVEKSLEQLSDKTLEDWGKKAMAGAKWRHGETEHMIIHFQKLAEAQRAAREAEAYYDYITKDLGLTKDYRTGKSHLFIFAKSNDWFSFCTEIGKGRIFCTSKGSEMFIEAPANSATFSRHLAFPVTSCVLYRFFPKRVPLWVYQGVSYFEEGNAYKKNKGIAGGERGSERRGTATYSLVDLLNVTQWPTDSSERREYDRTCEKLVRFLLTQVDRRRFASLVLKLGDGVTFQQAVVEVYPDKFKTYKEFQTAYNSFQ